jgi:phenylacetate-CoA ligase
MSAHDRGALLNVQTGLEPIETATTAELRAVQLERLRWSVRHAYDNGAHYRRAFDEAGVRPDAIEVLDDLAAFPFLTKQDLRDTYPFGMVAVPMADVVRLHASSGTTGKPTVVAYTRDDIEMWAGVMARSLRAGGATPADKLHVALGYGLFTGGLGFHYGAEALGVTVIPVAAGMTARQVQLITDFEPELLTSTPSYALVLAEEFERQGHDPATCSFRIGLFGGEPWTEAMRDEIERRLGIDALNTYGLSEVIGPGVAAECLETKDGLTVWEDHFYPEIVDPVTGAVLPDGEPGELVLTSLTKQAFPVIRYRTRDLTRLLPPTARPMRRIDRVLGRNDDMLIIRGVNLFPSQIEEVLVAHDRLSPHYLLEVGRAGHLDELDVFVEAQPGPDGLMAPDDQAAVERETAGRIKALVGLTVGVHVVEPGRIERSAGKAQRVVDRREL